MPTKNRHRNQAKNEVYAEALEETEGLVDKK